MDVQKLILLNQLQDAVDRYEEYIKSNGNDADSIFVSCTISADGGFNQFSAVEGRNDVLIVSLRNMVDQSPDVGELFKDAYETTLKS